MTSKTVYVLRTCNANLTSYNGFRWPASGRVMAPDWKPVNNCGSGLHGLLWGEGDGSHLSPAADARWLVVGVAEDSLIDLYGKVKFPEGEVVFCGDREGAIADIIQRGADPSKVCYNRVYVGDGKTAAAGDYGTAIAGIYGTATAGKGGAAIAGIYGAATAGYRGTATAGDYGTATAGNWGTAIAGIYGTAIACIYCTATAGDSGTATAGDGGTAIAGGSGQIRIEYHDLKATRYRTAIGYVGEKGIKPNTPYVVQNGKLVEK